MPLLGDDPGLDYPGNAVKAVLTLIAIELCAALAVLAAMALARACG
jgi:hypothetical protein